MKGGNVTVRYSVTEGFLEFFYVLYSTLLHLPPLRFHCDGGCWDRTRTVVTSALAVRSSNQSARSHSQKLRSCSAVQKVTVQLTRVQPSLKGYSIAQRMHSRLRRMQRRSFGLSVAQEVAAYLSRMHRSTVVYSLALRCRVAQKGATQLSRVHAA
jgi:hypothetical protein